MTLPRCATRWVPLAGSLLGCALVGVAGCSFEDGSAPERPSACVGTASQDLKVCAKTTTLEGIDVSYYQGNVDWVAVKASGHAFAFARVSDGVDHPDTKFARNWQAMKTAGLVRGAYQFFRPAKDVDAQVNLLVSKLAAAGGLQQGDLPPVLDLESDGGLPASTVASRAKSWLAKVEAHYGIKPIVYTAASMSNIIGNDFSGHVLWVAHYGTTCPTMPSGWTDWHFWQHSDKGSVAGISGAVDTNLFNGTSAQLDALTLQSAPSADGDSGIPADDTDGGGADDQGATLGSSSPTKEPTSPPFNPCAVH